MNFISDQQTLSDIGLIQQNKKTSDLLRFYDRTKTPGGQRELFKLLLNPISDRAILENRKAEINFILGLKSNLELHEKYFKFVTYYLNNKHLPLKNNIIDAMRDSIANKLKAKNDYYIIREGILFLLKIFHGVEEYVKNIKGVEPPASLQIAFEELDTYLKSLPFQSLLKSPPKTSLQLKPKQINALDQFFRSEYKKPKLLSALAIIYKIDVLQSHCELIRDNNFTLANYANSQNPVFETEECFHPLLKHAVTNSFKFSDNKALCLITGPNMSGKTTFMKSIGILTWMAHVGAPVPAKNWTIPVLNGIFTTINLSDSLRMGYSHFYAEVNRIREMALTIKNNGKILVILDELFRGTNVKDAFEGTLMIVKTLSKIRGTYFFISTHILEVTDDLSQRKDIDFKCFESVLNDDTPVYDYKLKPGISTERVGMQIIKNENIEGILNEIIQNQARH
jgi:DNA mismatch repair ATPase MutS